MKPGASKADQQTIRDSKVAGQRDVRTRARDSELADRIDDYETKERAARVPWWQTVGRWLRRAWFGDRA